MSEDPKHIESCRGIIKFLDATVKNIAVYPQEHPSVKGVSKRAHESLTEVLEGKDEIPLVIINGVLCVDDYHFNETTPFSENFLKTLSLFEIDELLISSGVTEEDVLKFAAILKSTDHSKEVFLRKAEEDGLKHIGLKGFIVAEEEEDTTEGIVNTYWEAVIIMTGFFGEVTAGRLPPLEGALGLVEGFRKYLATDRATLLLLTSLKGYERYTEQHCVNVCLLAMLLAEKEGLDELESGGLPWPA